MILLVHYFQKKLLKGKLYRKSLKKLLTVPYDETFIEGIRGNNISDEKLNQYQSIYILAPQIDKAVPLELQQVRRRYTGTLIALFPFIEGLDLDSSSALPSGIISCFDSVITSSYKYISLLRKFSTYSFAKYLPSTLALIKNESRPIKKSEIRIGFILSKSKAKENKQLQKITKTVDSLASEGFIVIGLSIDPDSDLNELQSIQKACPIFMIHSQRKKKIGRHESVANEIRKCTCLVSSTYEGFWLGICHNVPVVPLILNGVEKESMTSLSYEIGLKDLLITGVISSKELFKKINLCLKKIDFYSQLQEKYLIKSRLILGTIPKLNLIDNIESINRNSPTEDLSYHIEGISLPNYSYFVAPINGTTDRRLYYYLSYYNQSNGILFDLDVIRSLKSKVYLFEWIGIIRESIESHALTENKNFIASLNMCRGLYVFSEQIKKQLNKEITSVGLSNIFKVPIITLIYPVLDIFNGDIEGVEGAEGVEDTDCLDSSPDSLPALDFERRIIISDIEPDEDTFEDDYILYSELVDQNLNGVIIFKFKDSSIPLNNGLLAKCICKKVPVILRREDSYVELLGHSYPLFWNEVSEIEILCTEEKIKEASEYLHRLPKDVFTLKYFINSIHISKCLN